MAITSNLYPPLLPNISGSFIRTAACRIYFSLSIYNSADDIKNVQVSITNQRTNLSAFKFNLYPSGIKIADLQYDPEIKGDYNYYITIQPKDLDGDAFGLNQFYKVQLRFTAKTAPNPPTTGPQLATWLYDNMQHFSEWSRVCLIKGIEQPRMVIRGFDDVQESEEKILTTPLVEVIGQLIFNQKEENEYLRSYNIKLYNANNLSDVLLDSGQIYTNPYNPNQFNYQLTYDLADGVSYVMTVSYTTNNLYSDTASYRFMMMTYGVDRLNANITATVDDQNGRIRIDVIAKDDQKFLGNLTIRRTSSQSNFHKWEDVKTIVFSGGIPLEFTWYDATIESGVWYKYCAQKRNAHGDRGVVIQTQEPVMCILDDIFLTRDNRQLKIKFNPSLSEFKYNVTEAQQTTIGAKYPFITRNGNNYYRSFPIGGLITSFIDTTDWYDPHYHDNEFHYDQDEIKLFSSKEQLFGQNQQLYNDYNDKHNINQHNDFIYERKFRQKVYDFLYAHDVKLFRSTAEGNILVKLMTVDFQPMESLGRRVYSFTATAVQVDECNIENYDKYGIQKHDDYISNIFQTFDVVGQIQGTFSNSTNLINTIINTKYERQAPTGYTYKVANLKWIKIEITSEPYVIIQQDGKLVKAEAGKEFKAADATAGYIISINGKQMIINPGMERRTTNPGNQDINARIVHLGFFELKDPNTYVTELSFKYPTAATVDYVAAIEKSEDLTGMVSKLYYFRKPGQLWGNFKPDISLIPKISNKYAINYKKYYQKLSDIFGVRLEGKPGTVVYIQDSNSEVAHRHILENGYLQLMQDDLSIEDIFFKGIHLVKATNPNERNTVNGIQDFQLQPQIYDSLDEIKNPQNGYTYQLRIIAIRKGAHFTQDTKNRILFINPENALYSDTNFILKDEGTLRVTDVPEEATPLEKIYSNRVYNVQSIATTPEGQTQGYDSTKTPHYYALVLDEIIDDDVMKFVYYYGAFYRLDEATELSKTLIPGDIRHIRDDEYFLADQSGSKTYASLEQLKTQVTEPIPNGVYLLTDGRKYIYYHEYWLEFTNDNDVICQVDAIVDYFCEVVKGVY